MSDAKEVFPFLVTVFPGNLSKQDLLKHVREACERTRIRNWKYSP